jgi:hypothetical protein
MRRSVSTLSTSSDWPARIAAPATDPRYGSRRARTDSSSPRAAATLRSPESGSTSSTETISAFITSLTMWTAVSSSLRTSPRVPSERATLRTESGASWRQRQAHREDRAVLGRVARGDRAVVQVDDVARDREPESRARHAAPALELDAVEALEHALQLVLGDADPASSTSSRHSGPSARARRTTLPPWGENLSALPTRLSMSCFRRSGSPSTDTIRGSTSDSSVTPWRVASGSSVLTRSAMSAVGAMVLSLSARWPASSRDRSSASETRRARRSHSSSMTVRNERRCSNSVAGASIRSRCRP